jgi:DNA-directed RNA polymerase specialized sigma24 family protein
MLEKIKGKHYATPVGLPASDGSGILGMVEVPEKNLYDPLVTELEEKVRGAIREVSPDDGAVLDLVYVQNFSLKDAAEAAGISLPALKSRVLRAKRRIQEVLEGYLAA